MKPLRFVFGIHVHQPVGNFGHVFEEHTRDVYLPLLKRLSEREFFPIVMHLSGPLLEWLDAHHSSYLDLVGELAAAGRIEMLLSGYYEPILAALPREDRVEQILWMQDAIKSRFGVKAQGLWLTERVWEPELAADLANAGVRYVLVDDRHFLVCGFERNQLHVPWRTESDGRHVDVLAIDERLRYLIPFRPPSEIATYVHELRAEGHELAVFADDGEKFGGWPGTREWVYDKGWLKDFLATMEKLVASGEIVLSTGADALDAVKSGGLAYLPTASYREMEGWSLPAAGALKLAKLEEEVDPTPFIRGSHWKNFLAKYPESNRAHKKMMALSALCRRRGDPREARRAIGRAQCNDASWHGVFGGLYLPHLREAVWLNLARAEQLLRQDEKLTAQVLDFDKDGHDEVWFHSSHFSAVVAPSQGGAIIEYTIFEDGVNYADVLTRRFEAYHQLSEKPAAHDDDDKGIASIHHLEESMVLTELPAVDDHDRAILVDSLHADRTFEVVGQNEVVCTGEGIEKRIRFADDGSITVSWKWETSSDFSTELSLFRPLHIETSPEAERSTMPVETVAKSEKGLDRTVQGESITLRWSGSLRSAEARIRRYSPPAAAGTEAHP
ncbi:MAG TPA: alpha-amylase/4-alpha-glucanotransferase domain-containing protein [Gemmatimonadaceae bacterium]